MIDKNGQLVVSYPSKSPKEHLFGFLFSNVLGPPLLPAFFGYRYLTDKSFREYSSKLYQTVSLATVKPISKEEYFQDKKLLEKLWKLPSAQHYIGKDGKPLLEYQRREGYCGSATKRCILKSFGIPTEVIPPQKSEEMKPEGWCSKLVKTVEDFKCEETKYIVLETEIVRGDVSYEEFLQYLRRIETNENCRIAVNFLRSVITGFTIARWRPFGIFQLYAGHFSPVVGLLENDFNGELKKDDPFVAIWDTNKKFNGAYFVPAKRLFEAVCTKDPGSKASRALVIVEKKEKKN